MLKLQLSVGWQSLKPSLHSALRFLIDEIKTNGLANKNFPSFEYSQIFQILVNFRMHRIFFCPNRKYFWKYFDVSISTKYDKYFKLKGIFWKIIWSLFGFKVIYIPSKSSIEKRIHVSWKMLAFVRGAQLQKRANGGGFFSRFGFAVS